MSDQQLSHTPAAQAILNWEMQVAKLAPWEQEEIQVVRDILAELLRRYEASAALAIVRVGLDVGRIHGQ